MKTSKHGVPDPRPTQTLPESEAPMSDELTRIYLGHFSDERFARTSHNGTANWDQEILVSALDKCIHPAKSMSLRRAPCQSSWL